MTTEWLQYDNWMTTELENSLPKAKNPRAKGKLAVNNGDKGPDYTTPVKILTSGSKQP